MGTFDNLLRPGRIGRMEVRNRIVMAPMGSNFAESDGTCGERIQAYYEARAAGGAGLLTMGVGAIAYPHGTAEPYQVGLSDDKFIPGLKGIVDRVHKHGAKIAIQLQHAGKTSVRDLAEGRELWVPSMPPALKTDMFAALTREELGAFISSSKGREKAGVKIRVMDLTLSIYNLYSNNNAFSVFFRQNAFLQTQAYRISVIGAAFPSINYQIKF